MIVKGASCTAVISWPLLAPDWVTVAVPFRIARKMRPEGKASCFSSALERELLGAVRVFTFFS
jgi:hypothetical protein